MKAITLTLLSVAMISLTGCNTLKSLTGKKGEEVVASASQSAEGYYQSATNALDRGNYKEAATALGNIRTFYPTGKLAEQALLDLIYANFNAKDYEATLNNTSQFLQLYPNNPHLDYVLYAQGITNMQGSPKSSGLFNLKQSERDTAYLRLAFQDFSTLINRYPNSPYAADTALRMMDIYNQFAHHELVAAYWYIKRDAYVAAANRAKWVFQYYPQSSSVPEAMAILAYSNEQLGLSDTANQYKNLLAINYPQYLNGNKVRLPKADKSPWRRTLSAISFGKLGRAADLGTEQAPAPAGTVLQTITSAQSLSLPQD